MALTPIYTTRGEHAAFYENGYILNTVGEWIGFVDVKTASVFAIDGEYVGYMIRDGRILRNPMARLSRETNCPRYSSESRPRY